MELFPHQVAGVSWLANNPRCGLFDAPGLGKTAMAIKALDARAVKRALVVVPTVVAHNWQREIRIWSPGRSTQIIASRGARFDPSASVIIMTHGMLLEEDIVRQIRGFDAVILDEAHLFRNPTAKRTRIFYLGAEAVCRRTAVCWLLTGTPMPNNPTELWCMLAGLAPERLRGVGGKLMSYSRFRDEFCSYVPSGFGNGIKITGVRNAADLRARLKGFALARKLEEAIDLPPLRWGTVTLDGALSGSYVAHTSIASGWHLGKDQHYESAQEIFEGVQRDVGFSEWRHKCGLAKLAPAAELVRNELESGMHKIVLVAYHLDVIGGLADELANFGVVTITGNTSPKGRQDAVDNFQNDPKIRVAVVQITAGGLGVTLTAASDVAFVEWSPVPADNAQAAKRLHRIGQSKSVLVRFFSLAGSVDEVLVDILARKTQMIEEVMS